ncbi:iron-containing alcohol dehydrogenase [Bifidobacterium longum]|uniref:iron-containing alcohol dehydrogenase n=1 Tax=Bifidobacterium longum TaxID=216816 RepID=UPI00189C845B|nr:iron-containing alcohol dehydrogenase [Bifidobacterium longum]MDB6835759.1 iron-containing alcohol dehydrogenase [Bifidobacterium longum]
MRDFIFHNPVKIYFGKGQARHIAQEVERVEGAVLVVYGGGSIKRNGAYDDVMAALAGTGHKIIELPGVTPNPRLDKALEGVRLVKEHGVGLILAVGGGSVIDCAKFISLGSGIGDDEDLWDDYIETGKPAPEGLIPVGVVLTTAATGSEMGDAAVLTNWERNRKLGYTSFPLMPRFSVLDPSYLMTLPAEQTVYGFEDMFCHTCEQYFSYPVDDNLSDEIAEGIQRHILRSWRACLSDPKDYEARSNAMWDSTLALNRIISRGKEEDWATHGIEHALSAYTDIAHGAGLAVVHPHWMAYVYLVNDEVTARFARWAVDVWGVTPTGKTDRTVAEEGIDRYVDFLRRVGAPLTLSEAGVPDDPASLDKYADHAGEAGGSFVQIHRDDARAILEACKEPVSF